MKQFYKAILIQSVVTFSISSTAAQAVDSRSARSGKLGWVAAEAVGLTFFPVNGIRGGYFVMPDLSVNGSYATGSAGIGSLKFKKEIIEVGAKYFVGNSFYVDGNLAYEKFSFDTKVSSTINGELNEIGATGAVSGTGASFHIGNQWQWSGFTVGCDWAGYFVPLANSVAVDDGSGISDSEKKEEEKSAESNLSGGSVHLTRLYLGWAF